MQDRMILVFRRTGQRRYAVEAQRPGFPDVEMNPAPGYDRLMPHDMMHLVVEAQLGLNRAIFGQLAAGGDAGTFHLAVKSDKSSRALTRVRKRVMARGKKFMKDARDECMQSERATYICWQEWLARSSSSERNRISREMAGQAKKVRGTASSSELLALNERQLDGICKQLDQLSSNWSRLDVGESMAVTWPDLTILAEPMSSD